MADNPRLLTFYFRDLLLGMQYIDGLLKLFIFTNSVGGVLGFWFRRARNCENLFNTERNSSMECRLTLGFENEWIFIGTASTLWTHTPRRMAKSRCHGLWGLGVKFNVCRFGSHQDVRVMSPYGLWKLWVKWVLIVYRGCLRDLIGFDIQQRLVRTVARFDQVCSWIG